MIKEKKSIIKKVIPIFIVVSLVFVTMSTMVKSASPAVAYSSITNGKTFVDVWSGSGTNLTVNVTDADGDLQSVDIYTNASGTWANIYSSGALGGVFYKNTTRFTVSSWTGSLAKYYFNVTANDGSPIEFQYSFTTEYVFGDLQNTIYNDIKQYYWSGMYKNATGEYYMAFCNQTDGDVLVKTSTNGVDWFNNTIKAVDTQVAASYCNPSGWFTYNNKPAFFYEDYTTNPSYRSWAYKSGATTWTTATTNIASYYNVYSVGTDIEYYNSKYYLLTGRAYVSGNGYAILDFYYGTPPSTWTLVSSLNTGGANVNVMWEPNLNIFDSYLIITYKDPSNYFHYWTYDGTTLTDKSTVFATAITSLSVVRDPVANQLVAVYTKTGDLFYRVLTSPTGTWSSEYTITTGPATYNYVKAQYIDDRLVLCVANNMRSTTYYANYMMAAPDYSGRVSGFNSTYNRIVFPDADPSDTHINSSVFVLKNIDDRDITTIKWYAHNIGDVLSASNMEFWTNMSGSWVGYPVDANKNTTAIDISAASGSEWSPGEKLYWKLEILSIGGVAQTSHVTDENIYYVVTMAS